MCCLIVMAPIAPRRLVHPPKGAACLPPNAAVLPPLRPPTGGPPARARTSGQRSSQQLLDVDLARVNVVVLDDVDVPAPALELQPGLAREADRGGEADVALALDAAVVLDEAHDAAHGV